MNGTDLLAPVLISSLLLLSSPDRASAEQHEVFKLVSSNGIAYEHFGYGVAIFGNRIVVGAPYASSDVFVYDRDGNELRKLIPSDLESGDMFGWSISLEANIAVIGAPQNNDNGNDSGSAYVFDVDTGQQLFKLLPADGAAEEQFGWDVSMSGDRAVISAVYDDANGTKSGSAYVFDVATGQQLFKLLPGTGAKDDYFGRSVSLSGDLAIVSADGQDHLGDWSGAAYVFDVKLGRQIRRIIPPDGHAKQYFGNSVSLSGGIALIGAPGDVTHGNRSGAVYVYDVTTGQPLDKIHSSDIAPADFFGATVRLEGDLALVQSAFENGSWFSRVYAIDVSTGTELAILRNSDNAYYDQFGLSIDVDGDRLIAGAYAADDFGNASGAAYVFATPWAPGTGYCFGDPGSGTPCPCNNDNDGSVPGSGCDNGVFASGAQLTAGGFASVGDDSLVLTATHLEPYNTGLYFQAKNDLSPGVIWGNGLRCAGGGEIRLQVRTADAGGASSTTIPIAAKGGVAPGDVRYYQLWYRTTAFPPCGYGSDEFNTTNGYAVTWQS